VLVRGRALLLRGIGMGLGLFMFFLIVFSDGLKMMIGSRYVAGSGKMVVLACWVALGVRHDAFLRVRKKEWENKSGAQCRFSVHGTPLNPKL